MAWLLSLFGTGTAEGAATGAAGAGAAGAATGAAGATAAGTAAATGASPGLGSMLQGLMGQQQKAQAGVQQFLGMDDLQFQQFMQSNNEASQQRRERQMNEAQSPPQFYDFGFR